MEGLAANCLREVLLSILGLVEGLGSDLFGGNFATYPGANEGGFALHFSGDILPSTLGQVGALGSELFQVTDS